VIGIIAAFFVIRWARREGIDEDDLNLGDYFPKSSRLLSFTLLWVAVLSIVMLELLVDLNKHLILPGETEWAFGQVLSLVMIIASLREILNYFSH